MGEQRIDAVDCKVRESGDIVLQVRSTGNIDLEQWAAERAGEAFRQIYNRGISIMKAK